MKRFIMSILGMFLSVSAFAYTSSLEGNLSSGTVCVSANYDLLVPQVNKLSLQAVYYTVSPAAVTFTDGVRANGKITVTSNTGLTGAVLTINGNEYTAGTDWTVGATSSNTALSIYSAITSTYSAYSTGYLTVLSTYSLTNSSFTIYGNTFKEGTDWTVADCSSNTAVSIFNKLYSYFAGTLLVSRSDSTINLQYYQIGHGGDSTITTWTSTISVSGISGGKVSSLTGMVDFILAASDTIIYSTASAVGTAGNYTFSSSTPTALTVVSMTGGAAGDINYTFDKIVKANTYPNGLALLYTADSGSSPTGLSDGTTYYAISSSDGSYLKLATTKTNAVNGVSINLVKSATDNNSSLTLTPLTLAGDYTLVLQASNDGSNFTNLNVDSVTYSTTGSTLWDLSSYDYKYLRTVFTAGTYGTIELILRYFGKY